MEMLEEIEDISNLNEAETKWIEYYDTFRNGYNSTTGGENGFIVTEETKEKLSQANLGKKRSEETKEKIRQAHLGKKASEETKEKLRQAKLNISEETKEKIRQAKLGKKRGPYKINNRK